MSAISEFRNHRAYLNMKDQKSMRKVEKKFNNNTDKNNEFVCKVADIHEVFKQYVPYISMVLRNFLDNFMVEHVFGITFSEALVISVLMDKEFVAMLMCSNLLKRTLNLNSGSSGRLKLRIYIAILNFDMYKKSRWST